MSRATSYSDANKYTQRLLQIRYRVEKIHTNALDYYEVHRYATKSYSYIGMTEAAAVACQTAKIAQYTRTTYQWEFDENTVAFSSTPTTECMADIAATPNGNAWEVSIEVNEDDVVLALIAPANPATLFSAINSGRTYDEAAENQES